MGFQNGLQSLHTHGITNGPVVDAGRKKTDEFQRAFGVFFGYQPKYFYRQDLFFPHARFP